MRAAAIPAAIQSIPTNNNNQDVNPMGTIAARKAAAGLRMLSRVLAIEALTLAQGFDITRQQDPSARFAAASVRLVARVRAMAPFIDNDRPLYRDIDRLATGLLR
jgi:tyrosine ammonia-lyase